jgi:hypothetical protein
MASHTASGMPPGSPRLFASDESVNRRHPVIPPWLGMRYEATAIGQSCFELTEPAFETHCCQSKRTSNLLFISEPLGVGAALEPQILAPFSRTNLFASSAVSPPGISVRSTIATPPVGRNPPSRRISTQVSPSRPRFTASLNTIKNSSFVIPNLSSSLLSRRSIALIALIPNRFPPVLVRLFILKLRAAQAPYEAHPQANP